MAVVIVGAGPSGLAMAGCLSHLSIPYIILEREDCFASLWKKYAYDRLHLHLKKQVCELPHMPFPSNFPCYVPKNLFLQYLDDYVSKFQIRPIYQRTVESAYYDEDLQRWNIKARINDPGNDGDNNTEEYSGTFLVVATGETADPFVPEIKGLESFPGEILHSTQFKSGKVFRDKKVLVVGSGNSGMEIALDLSNHGAITSLIVRSPVNFFSKEILNFGLFLAKYLPFKVVEYLVVMLSKLVYGDLSKYGIERPSEGPFTMKAKYGKFPIIDLGTCHKIKTGQIQVLPAEIESIENDIVLLKNGKSYPFDSVVFCTGFKRSTHLWLKGYDWLLNDDGFSKISYPNNWKGKNGLYCVGLSRKGFYGAKEDAINIANDIKSMV
ncbi:probable indole-3-pyruvate monooxygenase YUCCA10 [Humulus lupulus]|uniref:probable indole-3-pyruvate monooxygenase YUCCA10 n=1 Tax=Humulus lupulus TaxID=3486 RepID=UPI002B4132AB|nr:probable indole-3-pyruvate monooxygenase YUCCA10 [Humulus lupulus]